MHLTISETNRDLATDAQTAEGFLALIDESFAFSCGRALPLGATLERGGINFSIFSEHATGVTLVVDHIYPMKNAFLEPLAFFLPSIGGWRGTRVADTAPAPLLDILPQDYEQAVSSQHSYFVQPPSTVVRLANPVEGS